MRYLELLNDNQTYTRMENPQWIQVYSQRYISSDGDLHFVIDKIMDDDSNAVNNQHDQFKIPNKLREPSFQDLGISSDPPDRITITASAPVYANGTGSLIKFNSPVTLHVSEAFSKRITDGAPSRIQISFHFLLVVSIFNLIKLLVMLWVLQTDRSSYLVTLGDAAASFLETPDPCTYAKCMLGKDEVLVRLRLPPDHPAILADEKKDLDIRAKGVWLPHATRYFYPVNSTGKGIYTAL